MRAGELEFRLRMAILTAIVVLGFWAPWAGPWTSPERISTLWWLTHGLGSISGVTATAPLVNVIGAILALIGAVLRVWGTAYLGYLTVHNRHMQAGSVMADGPYRYMRNPLYVGAWFTMAATALIMPPTGALLTMVLITVFYLRLTLGEEAFLAATLGQPYSDYIVAVPRFIPSLRSSLPKAGNKPHWLTAIFTELFPIGVFLTLAVLAWRYDHLLMLDGILWSFIASLLARGVMKALIPTLAFAAFFSVAWGWFHMYWPKAALIAFGVGLIVQAIFFGAQRARQSQSV
ncbi:MAG: isoprenylcysteine carboxylmethyltransferase family protein [Terracidiphilus sp.]|jgi:protein-S-isoprenylcysteine O-methyltransferase Ste14